MCRSVVSYGFTGHVCPCLLTVYMIACQAWSCSQCVQNGKALSGHQISLVAMYDTVSFETSQPFVDYRPSVWLFCHLPMLAVRVVSVLGNRLPLGVSSESIYTTPQVLPLLHGLKLIATSLTGDFLQRWQLVIQNQKGPLNATWEPLHHSACCPSKLCLAALLDGVRRAKSTCMYHRRPA